MAPSNNEVIVFANPLAGSQARRYYVPQLITALKERGLKALRCWHREELAELVKASATRLRCVIAVGGDGTFDEVINRAPGAPVVAFPLGNENLLARHFGFNRSTRRLASIIASGNLQRIDLARAGSRLFSTMASAGFDAEVVHRVHRHRRSHINKFDYLRAILQTVWTHSFSEIEVEIEETSEVLRGSLALIFNLPRYALGLDIAPRASESDGHLDLYVFERPGLLPLMAYFAAILGKYHERLAKVQHRRVKSVFMRSQDPIYFQMDGDPAGMLPISIRIAPQALPLIVPRALLQPDRA